MIRGSAVLFVSLALTLSSTGCGREGHDVGTVVDPNQPGGGTSDAGSDASIGDGGMTLADAFTPMDLAPDMTPPGKTCGDIALCAIQCGLSDLACSAMCFQGASGDSLTSAGTLIFCAATSCLGGGGMGGGGGLELFQCLATSCSMELAGCDGLIPFGGF